MAINFDEIWTNVKKNALGAKDLASLKLKLTKEKAHLDELYRALGENVYAVRTKQAVDENAAISEQNIRIAYRHRADGRECKPNLRLGPLPRLRANGRKHIFVLPALRYRSAA